MHLFIHKNNRKYCSTMQGVLMATSNSHTYIGYGHEGLNDLFLILCMSSIPPSTHTTRHH